MTEQEIVLRPLADGSTKVAAVGTREPGLIVVRGVRSRVEAETLWRRAQVAATLDLEEVLENDPMAYSQYVKAVRACEVIGG